MVIFRETSTLRLDILNEDFKPYQEEREEKSLPNEQAPIEILDDSTKEIMQKIRAINDALKKPPKKQQSSWNNQPQTGGGYIMDKETLQKLQQIIASAKLHGLTEPYNSQEDNINDIRYSRKFNLMQRNQIPMMSMPYITNLPVLMMPPMNNMVGQYPIGQDLNSLEFGSYQTKQSESPSPFQFQWPFASLFPVLIRDPLLSILNGGGWSNFIEYGQSADVCSKKHKSIHGNIDKPENTLRNYIIKQNNDILMDSIDSYNTREGRAIKKRNVSNRASTRENENVKTPKKIFSIKPASIKKPAKQSNEDQNSKTSIDGSALRLPFFGWLGNKQTVPPPPGFYINKLKVRRGGVAIAGPGGVATAGKGGAAIVGPGGLAYTQPGGLAVAGPAARVVALSDDVDLSSVVTRLQQQAITDGSVPQLLEAIPEGKVVATGPVIYYHPKEQS